MDFNHKGAQRGPSPQQIETMRDALDDGWRAFLAIWPAMAFFALIILISTLGYVVLGWPPYILLAAFTVWRVRKITHA